MRVIGDIHGRYNQYIKACNESERSVQVGDLINFPYNYSFYEQSYLDPNLHQFFGGNHDNYDLIEKCPHNLGDYGCFTVEKVGKVFFIRGAFSIDWKTRRQNHESLLYPKNIWLEKEQLTAIECDKVIELYKKEKPDIILSHECPFFVLPDVTNPSSAKKYGYNNSLIKTNTNLMLDKLHEIHTPKYHIFGHYHHWHHKIVNNCNLICVPILGAIDFYEDTVKPVMIGDDIFAHEINCFKTELPIV